MVDPDQMDDSCLTCLSGDTDLKKFQWCADEAKTLFTKGCGFLSIESWKNQAYDQKEENNDQPLWKRKINWSEIDDLCNGAKGPATFAFMCPKKIGDSKDGVLIDPTDFEEEKQMKILLSLRS